MPDYAFNGSISKDVLVNYLSRAVTHTGLGMDNFAPSQTFEDDLRMLLREGCKFVGRAGLIWEGTNEEEHFRVCAERASIVHKADPDMVLQGCIFEYIERAQVERIPVPEWALREFGLPVVNRCFSYDAMMGEGWRLRDHWGRDRSVPDITQAEARMFIFYRARRYLDAGFEGIHFGQVHLIGRDDPDFSYWKDVLSRVRAYARLHARRHYALCDAHSHGIRVNGEMLFDYNAFPIRLKEVIGQPLKCYAEEGYLDSIFGHSLGGRSPSGWEADEMPFMVEFDNFGGSRFSGEARHDSHFAWGYDEITWFSLLTREERAEFLTYLWNWVKKRYPMGRVQMPSRRLITQKIEHIWDKPDVCWLDRVRQPEFLRYTLDERGRAHIYRNYYSANQPSDACPFGFGDEDTIARCFREGEKQ